jgi:hypothetical protein
MTLVAFNGKLGSGKDTAGERLDAMAACPTNRLSFARPLKESAAALLDIPAEDWETYKHDPEVKVMLSVGYEEFEVGYPDDGGEVLEQPRVIREFTARQFLQRYGTESHRDVFGENFWVDLALESYRYSSSSDLTYITDCRFENEAEAVLKLGGVVVNVIGPDDDTGSHLSEAKLPDRLITFYLDNTKRDDGYAMLDRQLRSIAATVGIPVQ